MSLTSGSLLALFAFSCSLGTLAAPPLSAQSPSESRVPGDLVRALRSAELEDGLGVVWHAAIPGSAVHGEWHAPNRSLGMRAVFRDAAIRVEEFARGAAWSWSTKWIGLGRVGSIRPVEDASADAQENSLVYERSDSLEWYLNTEAGLEQGFTLLAPPEAQTNGPVALELALDTNLAGEPCPDARGALFRDECGEVVVTYSGLAAWDATGRELDARLVVDDATLTLLVDDTCAEYPLVIDPLIATSEFKLVPPTPTQWLRFGYDVKLDGDTAVVAAVASLYVFVESGGTWVQQAYLNLSSTDVDLEGDTLAIGDAYHGLHGIVFVYRRSGAVWQHFDTIQNPNANPWADAEEFGAQVDLSGPKIAILNTFDANFGGKPILVYRYSPSLGRYRGEAKIGGLNGPALALRGEELYFCTSGARVLHYRFDPSVPAWVFVSEILTASASLSSIDLANEDVLVVGSAFDDRQAGDAGAVYVLERFAGQWKETAKLYSESPVAGNYFGSAVAAHEGVLFASDRIDTPGTDAGAFQAIARNGGWTSMGTFAGSDTAAGDFFANTLDASASSPAGDVRVLAGAQGANTGAQSSGAAYLIELAHQDARVYCTSKLNSQGCVPRIGFAGTPSATNASPFVISVQQVLNNKLGVFYYGLSGRAATPFQDGVHCVAGTIKRTGQFSSGGNPPPNDCSGLNSIDFNARIQSGIDPNLLAGAQVNGQFWTRDGGVPSGTGLSEGIEFVIQP